MGEREYRAQALLWRRCLHRVAAAVPSLDFVGWHGEHWAVARGTPSPSPRAKREGGSEGEGEGEPAVEIELKELPARKRLDCGTGVDLGGEDAAWLERKDVPMDYEMPGLET
jgi:hypothetical protein